MDEQIELFSTYDFENFFADNIIALRKELSKYDGERLLKMDIERFRNQLEAKYILQYPKLSDVVSEPKLDDKRQQVIFRVSFTGDGRFFKAKSANSWTNAIPPEAEIGKNELIFRFSTSTKPIINSRGHLIPRMSSGEPTPENIKRWPYNRLKDINEWLNRFRWEVERHNSSIRSEITNHIQRVRSEHEKVLQHHAKLREGLGIKEPSQEDKKPNLLDKLRESFFVNKSNSQEQQTENSQQDIPKMTFNTPTVVDVGVNRLKEVVSQVQILLLTVNEWERKALLSEMMPLPGEEAILQGALSSITYRIGQFGNYCVAYTESTMGSGGRQGATLTAERAINELKPKVVLLLGIAFGVDRKKQKLGDVLIAESIFPYEYQKIDKKFSIRRGQAVPCGHTLSERFRMRRNDWQVVINGKKLKVNVHQGLVLSGGKVINNKEFLDVLIKEFPTAIGGEMEGDGAYSAVLPPTEVLLIKSICDWADGHKNDDAQPFAAFTSVSLTKHILSKPDVLHPLINP